MAGMPAEVLTGGAGFARSGAAQQVAPPSQNGVLAGAITGAPHVGMIGLVLIAVLVLFILDRAGFRFAVTAGKR